MSEHRAAAEELARPHAGNCYLSQPLDVYWHGGVPILRENLGALKGCDCGRDDEVQRIAAKLAELTQKGIS